MRQKNILLLLVVAVILVIGSILFLMSNRKTVAIMSPKDSQSTYTYPSFIGTTLNEVNNSGVSGIAALSEKEGSVLITMSISSPNGTTASLSKGSCGSELTDYVPLGSGSNTFEKTITYTKDQILQALPLTIVIKNGDTIVACGDLIDETKEDDDVAG